MHCFRDFPLSLLVNHFTTCTGDMLGSRERFKGFIPSIHDVSKPMYSSHYEYIVSYKPLHIQSSYICYSFGYSFCGTLHAQNSTILCPVPEKVKILYVLYVYMFYMCICVYVLYVYMCICSICVYVLYVYMFYMCICSICVYVLYVYMFYMCICSICVYVLYVYIHYMSYQSRPSTPIAILHI